MRNDVKPVIPPRHRGRRAGGRGEIPPRDEAFDDENASGRRRERGTDTDPAGPKRSSVPGVASTAGAVTDNSSTTASVSSSNDRLSTTTGKLDSRDQERSARMAAVGDVRALPTARDLTTPWVPVLMASLAVVIGILGLLWMFGAFSAADESTDVDSHRAGDLRRQALQDGE